MSVQSPFPVVAEVELSDTGYTTSIPCAVEWVRETEHGDLLSQAVDDVLAEYGENFNSTVNVRFEGDGHGMADSYEIIGVEENAFDEGIRRLENAMVELEHAQENPMVEDHAADEYVQEALDKIVAAKEDLRDGKRDDA